MTSERKAGAGSRQDVAGWVPRKQETRSFACKDVPWDVSSVTGREGKEAGLGRRTS